MTDPDLEAELIAELEEGLDPELVAGFDAGPDAGPDDDVLSAGCVAGYLDGVLAARAGDWRRPPDTRPAAGRRPPRRWDRGSATAEMAVALPALVVFLLAGMLGLNAIAVKMQVVAAAREGALSAARGGSGEAAARRVAPDGASVSVTVGAERAVASVSVRVGAVGRLFGPVTVGATSSAAVEPGVP